jgi:hypothetical protein
MKVLIAVLSCHSLRRYEQSIRDTWGKDIPGGTDLRFFLGFSNADGDPRRRDDEVLLEVEDSWSGITNKTVEMYRWAVEKGYDYVFKVDLDTLVRPQALLQAGFEQFDWVGGQNSFFASGGAGYWLSRRAMEAVVRHPVEPGPAEDVNTAHALLAQGIALHHDPRFLFIPGQTMDAGTITCHLSSVKGWSEKATPEDMYKAYAGTFVSQPQPRPIRFRRFR